MIEGCTSSTFWKQLLKQPLTIDTVIELARVHERVDLQTTDIETQKKKTEKDETVAALMTPRGPVNRLMGGPVTSRGPTRYPYQQTGSQLDHNGYVSDADSHFRTPEHAQQFVRHAPNVEEKDTFTPCAKKADLF